MTEIVEGLDGTLSTTGFTEIAGVELELFDTKPDYRSDAKALLEALVSYVRESTRTFVAGERIDWCSSLLVLRDTRAGRLTLDELDFDGTTVIPGVDNTLELWREQSALCRSNDVPFAAARYGSMVAVSPGVLESNDPLEGIRYAPTGAMSGWWLFVPDYDGTVDDFRSMRPTHLFHVLRKRRDVAPFLGLPEGYAFDMATRNVWLDVDAISRVSS